MKFHQEGMPFIVGSGLLALLAYAINPIFGVCGSLIAAFVAYFFRDPERVLPENLNNIVLSPCDGKVIDISEDSYEGNKFLRISVFLNVDDVHVNRAPISGKVTNRNYKKGSFAHAGSEKALENESLALQIEGDITMIVRQVAGMVARRIVCYPVKGDQVKIGDRYGIIKFGSRIDMFLPLDVKVMVKLGQTMLGGESIIAHF